MKRRSPLAIFALSLATACSPRPEEPSSGPGDSPDVVIANIEADLTPTFVIRGEERTPRPLESRMAELGVPAISVAVWRDGAVEWLRAWGLADVAESRPATTATLFQAASISKPVTATAALRLVEQGRLDLDSDVNQSLTSWAVPENEFTRVQKVTLRRLLSHTAGTTVWGFPGYGPGEKVPSAVGVLDGAGNTEPVRVFQTPGSASRYSGGGYTIVQVLMADVTGTPFPTLMRDLVFRPAGMTASTFDQPLPIERRGQAATAYRGDGSPVDGRFHVYPEMAAAGLWTTPLDLARFAMAIQASYAGAEGAILSPATTHEMLTPVMEDYGLGFGILDGGARFGHGGSNEGFRCRLLAWTDGSGGVAIMTNSDRGPLLADELVLTVAREYGWPGPRPRERVVATVEARQLEALAGRYRVGGLGDIEIVVSDRGLVARVLGEEGLRVWLPESETEFFDRKDGTQVRFLLQGSRVTGLVVGDIEATRID